MSKADVLMMLLKAKQSHLGWRANAEQLIKRMEAGDTMAPVDDHCCEFGKWWHDPATECLTVFDHYRLVKESHHLMHAIYRQIHELVVQNKSREAQERLLEFSKVSDALLDSLELLEQEVMSMPEC